VERGEAKDFEAAFQRNMTRQITLQPEAAEEANAAFNWYEDQQPGLGGEFYRELIRSLEFVVENPLLANVVYRGLRKRKLNRFPYIVVYKASTKDISVVSIFHGSRNPMIWKKRA
jgi:plasmid stabilization system protein ParE